MALIKQQMLWQMTLHSTSLTCPSHLGDQHQQLRSDAARRKRNLAFSPRAQVPVFTSRRHKPRSTICAILCMSGVEFAALEAMGSAPDNRRSGRLLAVLRQLSKPLR
jgi:hypothetical protein